MLDQLSLRDEIIFALPGLQSEDRALINPVLAEVAFALVLEKRTRPRNPVKDRGEAVKYSLTELYIGATGGTRIRRQKVYGAYFRLLVRMLGNRERRIYRGKRRAA